MKSTRTSLARIISTGFVVSLMLSLFLFWTNSVLRKLGKQDSIRSTGQQMSIALELSDPNLSDPNLVVRAPRVYADLRQNRLRQGDILLDIWLPWDGQEPYPWRINWNLDNEKIQTRWHGETGLIVINKRLGKQEGEPAASRVYYVGPEGFGDTPDRTLGRFSNPQPCCRMDPSAFFIHDPGLQTFFRIDLVSESVSSQSWADKSIITASRACYGKNPYLLQMNADGAFRWETDQELEARLEKTRHDKPMVMYMEHMSMSPGPNDLGMAMHSPSIESSREQVPFGPRVGRARPDSDLWAMDDQGIFYMIDRETLELSPPKGQLPDCGREKTHIPSQLLAYNAMPLFVDGQYFGLVAASLSRDGSDAVMVLLDSQGRKKGRTTSHRRPHHYRLGLLTSSTRSVLDSAQPLVLTVASSLWGPRTEAIAGYRSLFILPMSLPARIAGDKTLKVWDRIGTVIMYNVLTWCLGLLLAIAVIRDLKQRGMPKRSQNGWLFACMAFGWVAVITYLLTRPRIQFVTCTGCGRTRRTDQALCLHCQADWTMSALQPPTWCVTD